MNKIIIIREPNPLCVVISESRGKLNQKFRRFSHCDDGFIANKMKNNLIDKQLSCDLELAFPGFRYEQLVSLVDSLTFPDCSFENKEELGWGAVISKNDEVFVSRDSISSTIFIFLDGLTKVIKKIRSTDSKTQIILRVGIYYKTYLLTLQLDLKLIGILQDFNVELEISSYASSE